MSTSPGNKIRQSSIREHRRYCLDMAVGKFLDGLAGPEYVQERAAKYKEVSHDNKRHNRI